MEGAREGASEGRRTRARTVQAGGGGAGVGGQEVSAWSVNTRHAVILDAAMLMYDQ